MTSFNWKIATNCEENANSYFARSATVYIVPLPRYILPNSKNQRSLLFTYVLSFYLNNYVQLILNINNLTFNFYNLLNKGQEKYQSNYLKSIKHIINIC